MRQPTTLTVQGTGAPRTWDTIGMVALFRDTTAHKLVRHVHYATMLDIVVNDPSGEIQLPTPTETSRHPRHSSSASFQQDFSSPRRFSAAVRERG